MPLLGIGLDLELRYKYFPLSIYAQGGVNAYPTAYRFSILPTVEAGIRFPRGTFGQPKEEGPAAAAAQTGAPAAEIAAPSAAPPAAPPAVAAPSAPTITGLTVNPAVATVNQGATQRFTAVVNGTNNPPQTVTWSVTGGGAGTSISPDGLLTVGPTQNPGALTVRAVSTVDTSRSASAAVTVPAPAAAPPAAVVPPVVPPVAPPPAALTSTVTSIIVNPVTSVVPQGFKQQFAATVIGTNNPPQTVTWSVTGGVTGTSIDENGLLTVGEDQDPGTLTVAATSTADTAMSGTSTVTVPASTWADVPAVTDVTVIPGVITVPQGSTQQFNAQVTGTNNPPQTVTWEVTDAENGTTISPNGLLTVGANQAPGPLTVTAASTVDTVMSGTAAVTVTAAPPPPPAVVAPPPPVVAPPPPAAVVQPPPPPPPVPTRRDVTDTSKQRLFAEIHFEPDTAVLIESTRPQLEAAGRLMQANSGLWVLVRTYTAPFGTADGRFMVALDRARFCRDYLLRNYGISPERIILETLASERLPENVVIEEWITYRTAELIMIDE
jgi:outer membrane protein OmpA-like peptidoglycan-associated protein